MRAFDIEISDATSSVLETLQQRLTNPDTLYADIATFAELLTKDHLSDVARRKHKTANQLGAEPTGYLERAANGVSSESDAGSATVRISPGDGLVRAFRDVVIKPVKGKFLAIPVSARAYGSRPREFDDLFPLRVGPKNTLVLASRSANGAGLVTHYVLVREVRQKQDRELLPSDEEYADVAEFAAQEYLLNGLSGR